MRGRFEPRFGSLFKRCSLFVAFLLPLAATVMDSRAETSTEGPSLNGAAATVNPGPSTDANSLQPETTLTPASGTGNPLGDLPAPDEPLTLDASGHPRAVNGAPKPSQSDTPNSPLLMDPLSLTALQMAQTNAETLFDGVGGVPRPLSSLYLNQNLSVGTGFRRGDFAINPSVSVGVNDRSTSGSRTGNNGNEVYGLLSPAFNLSLGEAATGRILNLEYLGSVILGSRGDRDSQFDQSFAARGVLAFTKASVGLGLQFSQLSGGTRDTGGEAVNRQLLGISFTSSYQYSEKTSFEAYVTAPIRLFDQGDNSEGVTGTTFFNYAYSPLTTFGFGVSGGFLTVQQGSVQTFEQLLARFTYFGSQSLLYNGTLGVEFRDAGDREEINPILGFGLTWEAREGTRFTLSADRRVESSAADRDSNFVTSSVALTITQRLGNFLQAQGSFGFENADYERLDRQLPSDNRSDNYVVVQGGITAILNRRWTGSAVLTYGDNESTEARARFFQSLLQVTYSY